jgi:hypothetical protein
MPFAVSLRLPLGIERVPELPIVGGVVGADEEVARAQAPGEGVEAQGVLAFGRFRTGRVMGILPVGLLLLSGNYHTDFPCWVRGLIAHIRFNVRTRIGEKRRTRMMGF